MIEEFRKSANSILYQRVTSPFWGALIVSWIIWNWEIIYLSFFVPSDKLSITKIDYIKQYLNDNYWNTYLGPIITLIIILVFLPFISNGAYWLSMKFNGWKVNQKRILEGKIPLTVEESVKLRNEILKQEEIYSKINKQKDEKILEQSKIVSRVALEKTEWQKENQQLRDSNDELKSTIQKYKDRDNFNRMFKRVSVYEVSGKEKNKFQINANSEIQFNLEDNKYEKYDLNLIRNYSNDEFVILMYPQNPSTKTELDIRLLSIKRTSDIHEYEGNEIRIKSNKSELLNSEMKSIKIYDL